jgi:hypothetical protein
MFAEKILAALGPTRSVSLSIRNISALNASDSAVQQELQAELVRHGLQIVTSASAETTVEVTLSEGIDGGYLWVAAIHGRAVHGPPGFQARSRPVPALRDTLLLQQPEPILDFAQAAGSDGAQFLLVLEPDRLALLEQDGFTWTRRDWAVIRRLRPWPRDLRGRVTVSGTNGFRIFLPGVSCTGTWLTTFTMECREDAEVAWPLGEQSVFPFRPDRNYFGGPRSVASRLGFEWPISYSIASIPVDGAVRWIITKPDGNAQLFEAGKGVLSTFSGWGDDIVSTATGCGAERHVLTPGAGDWTEPDHMQAYEIADQQGTAVGQPLDFRGPILALWPSDDGKSARAVSRNLHTGMYEASIVSVSCGD